MFFYSFSKKRSCSTSVIYGSQDVIVGNTVFNLSSTRNVLILTRFEGTMMLLSEDDVIDDLSVGSQS